MDLQFRRRKAFGVEKKDGITDVSGKKEGIKVLGVAWTQEADVFTFRINNTQNVIYTRRGLLSKIAGMFDPLGLVVTTAHLYFTFLTQLGLTSIHFYFSSATELNSPRPLFILSFWVDKQSFNNR